MVFLFVGCDIYITRGCWAVTWCWRLLTCVMRLWLRCCRDVPKSEWEVSKSELNEKSDAFFLWVAYSKISSRRVWFNLFGVVLTWNLRGPGTILPFFWCLIVIKSPMPLILMNYLNWWSIWGKCYSSLQPCSQYIGVMQYYFTVMASLSSCCMLDVSCCYLGLDKFSWNPEGLLAQA